MMERYVVWYTDSTIKAHFFKVQEAIAFACGNTAMVTVEFYDDMKFVGKKDYTIDEFQKVYMR